MIPEFLPVTPSHGKSKKTHIVRSRLYNNPVCSEFAAFGFTAGRGRFANKHRVICVFFPSSRAQTPRTGLSSVCCCLPVSLRLFRCFCHTDNKQSIMRIEDRLFDRGWVRSAMATRKCGNIYFQKYFIAARKFTNIFVLLLILMIGSRDTLFLVCFT